MKSLVELKVNSVGGICTEYGMLYLGMGMGISLLLSAREMPNIMT
jgi:hypothetical protein